MTTHPSNALAELQHYLQSPPVEVLQGHHHHHNPVAVAHAALEHLRDTGDVHWLFLRVLLQAAATDTNMVAAHEELIFHCVTGCRQVVLWQWRQYPTVFRQTLRQFFMAWAASLRHVRTVRWACWTAAAAFWKRGWQEEEENEAEHDSSHTNNAPITPTLQALLDQMRTILLNNNNNNSRPLRHPADLWPYLEHSHHTMVHTANFLQALVGEFAGPSAVAYGLPLEFHKRAHRVFTTQPLTWTLQWALQALSRTLSSSQQQQDETTTLAVLQLIQDVLHWEFGMSAWNTGAIGASSVQLTLLRPPVAWRELLLGDGTVVRGLVQALQQTATEQRDSPLAHSLRQVIIAYASLTGAIFPSTADRKQYAAFLLEVTVPLLHGVQTHQENAELLDYVQLMGRLVSNFKLSALAELPALMPMLQTLAALGNQLLADQIKDCARAGGNLEAMELREWREDVLKVLLDSAVLLSSDPWLLYAGTDAVRRQAQQELSHILGPLYEGFVHCRTRMAALEEYYVMSHDDTELDEEEEEIRAVELSEEMTAVASFGRLNLDRAIDCLATLHGQTMPRLQALWEGHGDITPEIASLLEEFRLLTIYVSQLLTDDNKGEQPAIPEAVIFACENNPALTPKIVPAVQALLHFANEQVARIAQNPRNLRLSPILAKTLLLFIERWAPAYIYPDLYQNSPSTNPIVLAWSTPEKARESLDFIISLCASYMCYWPQEKHVQEVVARVLIALARRKGKVRKLIVGCPSFTMLLKFHCLTAGVRHTASDEEFYAMIREKAGQDDSLPLDRLGGFQRLPYYDRSHVLTFIMIACSEESDPAATALLTEAMKAVHNAFGMLTGAFESNQIGPDDINMKEMATLCLEMFCGIADAGEMSGNERIPHFVTPFLGKLASLMQFYAVDLGICEIILRFFRDYTENFVAVLTREQTLALFHAVADLLKSYSANHCVNRVIKKSNALKNAEEEQAYEDIETAIQLLVNLGAKDFIDADGESDHGIESTQVTNVIFFGLQQILPLMTQGLLQLPTLCSLFFNLVGFMMETYPDKVCALPYDLFDSLLQSLLYGMSHHDSAVGIVSLQGLSSIAREHLKAHVLQAHLTIKPELLDDCIRRLIMEVVVQALVTDRTEACGMALLPLAAANVHRLGPVLSSITQQVPNDQQRHRLEQAFTTLLQMEMLSKAGQAGFEGRSNRMKFKDAFQVFVNDVHSFLILK